MELHNKLAQAISPNSILPILGRTNHQVSDHDDGHLNALLDSFHSHELADLNKANLMDRVDVKFMLPNYLLPTLLRALKFHYSVLEVEQNRISTYYNEYFDTPDMSFYYAHHNGRLNRFKVRQRTYVDTNTRFLEVKFKNNQRRTIKRRVTCPENAKTDMACQQFIAKKLGNPFAHYCVTQQSGYRRIALANEASAERVTIDFNLWFRENDDADKIQPEGFFIAELKQSRRSKLSPFFQLMTEHVISPISFSKYCIGCALLYQNTLKTNQFKPVLTKLNQFSTFTSH
ncbi:polyphosphate polymerase domain-containing protein [Glaciecola sp. MH2013]|uniref:polyphosphate polymerase domain-containing protein n=1 Tax=Glaciecola sp. MH2013 TaxID=2785524 RepID=UPI00189DAED6|nr:polyphosphate polymerase domain-containing protein [Glaciecola sp. MH2013]MBF7074502.1 polyphosphate polymerase domain-containing protein [Glaciecola sp. MH2013]